MMTGIQSALLFAMSVTAAVALPRHAAAQATQSQATMKAVRVHAPGGIEALTYEDAPRPEPRDSELLIHVIAAGVNPVDAKIRASSFGRRGTDDQPLILGWDVAGIVDRAGPKATKFKEGDAIFAFLPLIKGGGYAEYALVDESIAVAKPQSLTFVEAAAVPLAAMTAWQAMLDAGKLHEGQTVLIQGGSGGVGAFAVQIAKARGARVIATASTANQEFLKQLGADLAIDYTKENFEDVARDVDLVLDTVGGDTQKWSFNVLKVGGSLISIVGGPNQQLAKEKGVIAKGILVKPDAAELQQIAELIDAGKIKVTISQIFPLADAAKAHQQIETGHTKGKIVLKVGEEPKP